MPAKKMLSSKTVAAVGFWILATVLRVPAAAAEDVRVAVLPYFVHSQESLAYLEKAIPAMLASRLDKQGEITTVQKPAISDALKRLRWERLDERRAQAIGRHLHADFVVTGSLTKIDKRCSLDTVVIDVSGTRPSRRLYLTVEDADSLPAS